MSSTTPQINLLAKGKDKKLLRSPHRLTPVIKSFSKLYLVPTNLSSSITGV